QRDTSLAVASRALGRPVLEAEASSWWARRALEWIASEPLAALRAAGLKLADSLSSTEYEILYPPGAARWRAPLLWVACVPFGALLGLAALGWGAALRGRGLLVAWLAAGLGAGVLFFTYSRFRLPALPALMPFAGAGAVRALGWARGGARPAAAALA